MAERAEETLRAENALLRMALLNLLRCWRNMEAAPLSSDLFDTAHTQWKTAMANSAKLLGIKPA